MFTLNNFLLPFLALALLFYSCKSQRSSLKQDQKVHYKDIILIAWNEDTILTYEFALTRKNKFYYTVINNKISPTTEHYHGKVTYLSNDTLALHFFNNQKPKGIANYLVFETSGTYLIQPLENTKSRIYLRKIRRGRIW